MRNDGVVKHRFNDIKPASQWYLKYCTLITLKDSYNYSTNVCTQLEDATSCRHCEWLCDVRWAFLAGIAQITRIKSGWIISLNCCHSNNIYILRLFSSWIDPVSAKAWPKLFWSSAFIINWSESSFVCTKLRFVSNASAEQSRQTWTAVGGPLCSDQKWHKLPS